MTVHLDEYGITYVSAPKCGSSTLKNWFFEVENGFRFRSFVANGRRRYIHGAAYPAQPFKQLDKLRAGRNWCFAIVRDPVARLLSHWRNQVVQARVLDGVALTDRDRDAGLTAEPGFKDFLRNLDRYRELSQNVRHHTQKLVHFLGRDAGFYDALYDISDLPRAVEELTRRITGAPVLQSTNVTGSATLLSEVDQEDRRLIRERYAADYDLFGGVFQPVPA